MMTQLGKIKTGNGITLMIIDNIRHFSACGGDKAKP